MRRINPSQSVFFFNARREQYCVSWFSKLSTHVVSISIRIFIKTFLDHLPNVAALFDYWQKIKASQNIASESHDVLNIGTQSTQLNASSASSPRTPVADPKCPTVMCDLSKTILWHFSFQ